MVMGGACRSERIPFSNHLVPTGVWAVANIVQRALWQAKEALKGKAQALKETREAREEEERIVRKWQASGLCLRRLAGLLAPHIDSCILSTPPPLTTSMKFMGGGKKGGALLAARAVPAADPGGTAQRTAPARGDEQAAAADGPEGGGGGVGGGGADAVGGECVGDGRVEW